MPFLKYIVAAAVILQVVGLGALAAESPQLAVFCITGFTFLVFLLIASGTLAAFRNVPRK